MSDFKLIIGKEEITFKKTPKFHEVISFFFYSIQMKVMNKFILKMKMVINVLLKKQ